MSDHKFCCDEFAEQATDAAQFIRYRGGTWAINARRHVGSCVAIDMRFCPFCGSSLTSFPNEYRWTKPGPEAKVSGG